MTPVYTPHENSGSSVPKALTLNLHSHKFNVETRHLGILLKMQSLIQYGVGPELLCFS